MSIVSDLRDRFGSDITATEVKKYARGWSVLPHCDSSHRAVQGQAWYLEPDCEEAREQFEQTVAAQNLVPAQDSFVSFWQLIVSRK